MCWMGGEGRGAKDTVGVHTYLHGDAVKPLLKGDWVSCYG